MYRFRNSHLAVAIPFVGLAVLVGGLLSCEGPEDPGSSGLSAPTVTAAPISDPPGSPTSNPGVSPATGPGAPTGTTATVVRIVDGDTIVVRVEGADERVRLTGIDTPETVDPRKPVQCFGREASAHLRELLPVGTPVVLVSDVEPQDRFGRWLRYVYRASDNAFINLALVDDGYARVYTYPPNVAHAQDFRAAERRARDAGRGLWGAC